MKTTPINAVDCNICGHTYDKQFYPSCPRCDLNSRDLTDKGLAESVASIAHNQVSAPSYEEKMAHIAIQRLFQSIPKGFDPHSMGTITIKKYPGKTGLTMMATAPLRLFISAHVQSEEVAL
jgi:hypothetical protein